MDDVRVVAAQQAYDEFVKELQDLVPEVTRATVEGVWRVRFFPVNRELPPWTLFVFGPTTGEAPDTRYNAHYPQIEMAAFDGSVNRVNMNHIESVQMLECVNYKSEEDSE